MGTALLAISGIVVSLAFIGGLWYVLGRGDRIRRARRAEHGVRANAVVARVDPMATGRGRGYEQPFHLRFTDTRGNAQTQRLTAGFGGIVPVVGWRVGVVFDPDDPANVAIEENPYLHGLTGAPAADRGRAARVAVILAIVVALLFAGLGTACVLVEGPDRSRYVLAAIGLFFCAATVLPLSLAAWMLRSVLRMRRRGVTTTGTVTHSWTERRRSSNGGTSRVHLYVVLFDLPDGRQVHRRAPESGSRSKHTPGRRLEVAFDPADPTVFQTGSLGRRLLVPIVILALGGVFAVLGIAFTATGLTAPGVF
ncbi:uncharacterized protein DUF3592 [Murinocardiopsis flavida]|uniref:Uncharacterized protein DUF3592 n=1 Tax=Murinocardiopsis flavida TaxID=645275 RepID=A0A2P8DSJ3_9ACTN|nr:DUF3592 domain-containing protein [Murinocardiopsis flavida]PSL00178.1 uncharacterized protein DUF3592 [Murinocardiopsis flavida]